MNPLHFDSIPIGEDRMNTVKKECKFQEKNPMKKYAVALIVLAGLVMYLTGGFGVPAAFSEARDAFGFNTTDIAGFPTGKVTLTGGGAYVPGTNIAPSGGHFRCTETVLQGPFNGCLAGQGVRWDTAGLLASTTLKCTGGASEALKTAMTSNNTVVLAADFYRQGDGDEESFTAKMVVSENDIAPDIPGVQTVWIQGVGCGTGIANFN
jgi:hypothetical protein